MEEWDAKSYLFAETFYANDGLEALYRGIHHQVVLDVGCGAGDNGAALTRQGCTVHGITLSQREAESARPRLARVIVADVEMWEPDYPERTFDSMVFSHVLEHLVSPERVLQRLAPLLKPAGKIYLAVPNVLHWTNRLKMLLGHFSYTEQGILDRTHLRFYTVESIQDMVRSAGFKILNVSVEGHFPLGPVRRVAPRVAKAVDHLFCHSFPGLFGFHLMVECIRKTD